MTPIGKVYYQSNRPYCEGEEFRDRDGQKHEYVFVTVQYTVRFIKKKLIFMEPKWKWCTMTIAAISLRQKERSHASMNLGMFFIINMEVFKKWIFSIYLLAPPSACWRWKQRIWQKKVYMILVLQHLLFTRW